MGGDGGSDLVGGRPSAVGWLAAAAGCGPVDLWAAEELRCWGGTLAVV